MPHKSKYHTMRKKISKKLSFNEVNEMTIHEILKAMEITLGNDTDEKTMENDCQSLGKSWEMRVKFDIPATQQWTYLEKKLNFIILTYAAARKYRDFYADWDEFVQKLDNCRYEDTNVINKPYQTVCFNYDMDAFTRNVPIGWSSEMLRNVVLDYTNTSLSKASDHLSFITGLDKGKLKNFCDTRLLNEILDIRIIFERIYQSETIREWHKKLVNEINDNIYPVPNNSMQEFLTDVGYAVKRIIVADYVIFLTVIKHAIEKDHDLVVRYLTQKDDNNEYFPVRFELFKMFARTYPFNENNDYISICPQEHLFALNNYFKPEYVYGTENGDNAYNINRSLTDKNPITMSATTSEGNDCIAIDIEAPIKEDPVIMEQVDNLLKTILNQDWFDRNGGKAFCLPVNRHKRK